MGYGRAKEDAGQLVGRIIESAVVADDQLTIRFADGSKAEICDVGQDCCEHRYMVCDDDLQYHAGAKLLGVELLDAHESGAPNPDRHYDIMLECQFLVVTTSKGKFTVANYNSHNGYYGGFNVSIGFTDSISDDPNER